MKSLSLILPYFVEQRLQIFCGIFCLIAVDFLQLFIPRILKRAVDDLTLFTAGASVLMRYALYLAAIALLMSVFRYGWRRCLIGFSRRVEEGLRNQLFSHVQHLSAEYFQEVKTGDLMAHATNDIQNVRMAMGMGLVALTDAVVLGTAAVGFMAFINVRLTLFALIPAPFIIFGTRIFSRKMHRRYLGVQQEFSNITEAVRERFAGIRIIKAYNRKADEIRRISEISRSYVKSNMNLVRLTGSFFPLMMFFSNLSLALVFFLGGRQTISLEISPGDFVAFISYIGLLTWPMMAIGWVTNLIQRGRASMDRLQIISQTRPKIADAPDALSFQKAGGRIRFDGVCFSYPPSGPKALRDVDFLLKPGEVLGIVGPPGSGKTSLVGLIPRIFDVSSGKILLDGIEIRGIKLEDLRAQISFMPQEPFLFA
ncbi:MAG: ABC transporter transmembrane domain-containing protein, partial [Desulfobacterales bacterium]|nr:ABC transporter transmembrane domain-containing protein [Desulfobacterales bacterium]